MTRILSDADIQAAGMRVAVDCMEDAFRQHAAGQLIAPGRVVTDVDVGQLVFTVGASTADQPVVGFRCYDLKQLNSPNRAELTVVLDAESGSLCGLVVGPLLGAVRTGAIGGVAINCLARRDTESLGVIGTGYQAQTQLAAALTVRKFNTIRVFSRNADRRCAFTERMSRQLDCDIRAVDTARHAAEDADVLICCTTSSTPVVKSDWLKPGVHINNIGPKFKASHELGMDIFQRASQLVTDAPAQIEAYGEDFVLSGTPLAAIVKPLSEIVTRGSKKFEDDPGRRADSISVFVSLGLAGTEVLLAKRLLDG